LCLEILEPGISVIAVPGHANKREKINGNGTNSKWTLITGQIRRKVSGPGGNKTLTTGNCIVRESLNTVNETANYSEIET